MIQIVLCGWMFSSGARVAEFTPAKRTGKAGFTLIELSIVLVIIGLIVGGVLVGQDLIKAAAIRADISAARSYATALNTFKLKYNALPGDMSNASAIIPGVTHDGNGDGLLSRSSSLEEYVYVWEHLSKAQLINSTYDGNYTGGTCGVTTCPSSKLYENLALYMGGIKGWWRFSPIYGNPAASDDNNIAIQYADKNNWDYGGFNVFDAYAIDKKVDDGIAASGKFMTINNNFSSGNCVTGDGYTTDGSAIYNMNDTVNDCYSMWIVN